MSNYSDISYKNTQVIKYPIITDKAIRLVENNQYSFIVDRYVNKIVIKSSIENLFDVKVIKVNTCRLPRKKKRVGKYIGWHSQYKKAVVTLAQGDIINLFTENS